MGWRTTWQHIDFENDDPPGPPTEPREVRLAYRFDGKQKLLSLGGYPVIFSRGCPPSARWSQTPS